MTSQPPPGGITEASTRSFFMLAACAGLLTGLAELLVVAVQMLGPGFVRRTRDAVWMVPAFDAALFLCIGIAIMAVARFRPVTWRLAASVFTGLGALLVLLLVKQLHWAASILLAAAAGTQTYRLLARREAAGQRFVRRGLPWLALLIAAAGVTSAALRLVHERRLAHSRPAAAPGAPNILLLILDTVRAADLSLYGYARPTTPELERFATRGTTFDHAFSAAPWTLTSHASIFTGRWPLEMGATWEKPLGPRWPVLAELLRARGYATAGFAANDLYVTWETGLSRGFEHFDDFDASPLVAFQSTSLGRVVYPALYPGLKRLGRLPGFPRLPLPEQRRPAPHVVDAFLDWSAGHRGAPFFAFLNLMDAHAPYTASDSFRHRFQSRQLKRISPEAWDEWPRHRLTPADVRPRRDAYDGSIALIDREVGRLLRTLERRGLLENTLVVVTADHGDEYAEHGLVDHGRSLYRLALNVPLMIEFPGHVSAGRRVHTVVSLRNLAATILQLTGAEPPFPLPGHSLARFWSSDSTAPDTIVASVRKLWRVPKWYPASRGNLNSIGFDGLRYIRNEGDKTEELYDLDHDLLERWNLAGTPVGDTLLPRYRAALDAIRAAGGRQLAGENPRP